MTGTMTYKGYSARVEFEDDLFVGHIARISDIVGFHADTVADLRAAFEEAVDNYLKACERTSKAPERSFSGKVMFRMDPEVHRRAVLAAKLAGKSLNQWAQEMLSRAAG